jgi:TIR domain
VEAWYDREILAGSDVDQEIDAKLAETDIFLALVSPDFLASHYCYEREMATALKKHTEGTIRVVPVIIEPCDWTPLKHLKALPKDGQPISTWPNENAAYLDVVTELRRLLSDKPSGAKRRTVETPAQPKSQHLPPDVTFIAYGHHFKALGRPYTPEQARELLQILGHLNAHVASVDVPLCNDIAKIPGTLGRLTGEDVKAKGLLFLDDINKRWGISYEEFRKIALQDANYAQELTSIFKLDLRRPGWEKMKLWRKPIYIEIDTFKQQLSTIPTGISGEIASHMIKDKAAQMRGLSKRTADQCRVWVSAFQSIHHSLRDDLVFLRNLGLSGAHNTNPSEGQSSEPKP